MPSSRSFFKNTQRGFSVTELLIVLAMISVIAGFAVVSIVRGNRSASSTSTAVEIAGFLQKARVDSMRRGAKDLNQMAQVKIFNRRFYSIAIDGDGDGNLDVPLVKSLPEQTGVEISGPFPKSYIFDWQGQTVDLQNKSVSPQSIVVGNSSAASAIKFAESGKIVVVPGVKMPAK
ncbi:MAG TPA: prepilin-type N-terminal cleavage/methylation domain-containing protein [Pyrinomonadaceae bacterium]|jgi:prepilin-type N-terminal cleavage/methylation domain-containing protein|nr:prepilin-type N-terminal cleavage/methylation domain-containing protein [Pyrinomonadaceae bacterium]